VVELSPGFGAVTPRGRRLHGQDADGVDFLVGIKTRVGALAAPIAFLPIAVRHFSGARPGAGDFTLADDAVGKGLTLVQTRCADEAEGRSFRQLGSEF